MRGSRHGGGGVGGSRPGGGGGEGSQRGKQRHRWTDGDRGEKFQVQGMHFKIVCAISLCLKDTECNVIVQRRR